MRLLVAYYSLVGFSVKVVMDGKQSTKDVYATWSLGEPDSLINRSTVLEQVKRHLGVGDWDDSKIELTLSGMVPPGFQPENRASIEPALAAYRAKCVVTLRPKGEIEEYLERCFEVENSLADALNSGDQGYVDGNDVGGGEFRIFCHGKRKEALRKIVDSALCSIDWAETART